MIKNIFFTLLVLSCFQAIGQSDFVVTGKIIDKKTKEPLPYSTIIYQNKSIGTISNVDGYYSLSLYNAQESDSITISYVGYESLNTTIAHCLQVKNINLEPTINEIKEVVVEAEKFKLKSFVKEVISEYNKNRKAEPHIAISHYREKAKDDNKFIMYMESIGYSVYAGKKANVAPLSNYNFFCENTKCYFDNSKWLKYQEDYSVRPSGGSNLNVFRVFEIGGILSKKHYSKYSFKIDSTYFIGNAPVYCIGFKGNNDAGSMHVFADSKQIFKIECSTNKYWSNVFYKRVNAHVNVQFNYFEDTPFISIINANYKVDGLEYMNTLTVLVQKFNNFKLSKDEYWSFNNYAINPYIEYLPDEWKTYSIDLDKDFEKIAIDLKSNTTALEQHFINNSGRWFFENERKSELAKSKLKELKSNF